MRERNLSSGNGAAGIGLAGSDQEVFTGGDKLDAGLATRLWDWEWLLVTERRFDEAVAPLRQAATLQPTNTSAHYNLGLALLRSGKKEEAEKEFEIQRKLLAEQEAAKNAGVQNKNPQ